MVLARFWHLLLAMVLAPGAAFAAETSAPVSNFDLSPKDPPAVTRLARAVIAVEGDITPEVTAKFASMLDENVRTLAIYSGGGDPQSARTIGRLVHRRGLDVVAVGLCGAVCARYVFLAGAQRIVAPDSAVAFTGTVASVSLLAAGNPDPAVREIYASEVAAEKAYYQELGLPERLLYDPQDLMQTRCYQPMRDAGGHITDIGHAEKYRLIVFPKSYFDAIGVAVAGYWPTDVEDIKRMTARLFRPNTPFGWLLHVNVRPLDQVQESLREAATCPAESGPASAPP